MTEATPTIAGSGLPASWSRRELLLLVSSAALVLLSRLPFLDNGYGLDSDAWLAASAAKRIAQTGEYWASRLPGHPVQELTYALIWNQGPAAFNLLTSLFTVAAFVAFALIWRTLGSRDYLLAALAFAFTSIIYIHSMDAMDYLWALAFILGSLYFVLHRRVLIAGVLLGLAVGNRLTSAAMLLPFALIIFDSGVTRDNLRRLVILGLSAGLVSIVTFLPVWWRYGSGFTDIYTSGQALLYIVKRSTEEVWGLIGLLALVTAVVLQLFVPRRLRNRTAIPAAAMGRCFIAACVVAILLHEVVFLCLPHEGGYLIPAAPYVLLLLGRFLYRPLFLAVCVALLLSSFLLGINEPGKINSPTFSRAAIELNLSGRLVTIDPLRGPVFLDQSRRAAAIRYTEQVIEASSQLPPGSVVAVGEWIDQVRASLPPSYAGTPAFIFQFREPQMEEYLAQGRPLYFLPGTMADRLPPQPPGYMSNPLAPQPLLLEP
jgi:hypothetical protein